MPLGPLRDVALSVSGLCDPSRLYLGYCLFFVIFLPLCHQAKASGVASYCCQGVCSYLAASFLICCVLGKELIKLVRTPTKTGMKGNTERVLIDELFKQFSPTIICFSRVFGDLRKSSVFQGTAVRRVGEKTNLTPVTSILTSSVHSFVYSTNTH